MTEEELLSLARSLTDNPSSIEAVYENALRTFEKTDHRNPALEFGTRCGGSALSILAAIRRTDPRRVLITVDPYGSIPYVNSAGACLTPYGNELYRIAAHSVSGAARALDLNWAHFLAKDVDYMAHIWPHVPVYLYNPAIKSPHFSFAYLDAEHTNKAVQTELSWLKGRSVPGATVVIDDKDWLDDGGGLILSSNPGSKAMGGALVLPL